MHDLHDDHGVSKLAPNTFVMNALLNCWSKCGDPNAGVRAEEIVLQCEKEYKNGNHEMRPNTRMYGLVLSCWSKSSSGDKAIRAKNILERMENASNTNENVLSNVHCYNAVINAAAFTEGTFDERTQAFHVATDTLNTLFQSKTIEPISSTFGTYLKVCGKLSLPNNLVQPHIGRTFEQCKTMGLVNDFVLTQVRFSTHPDQYNKLLGKHSNGKRINERVDVKEIPSSWKRNVVDRTHEDERGDWWKPGHN